MDAAALRSMLGSRALAGADWHELTARLAAASACRFRLIAADGALLVEATGGDGDHASPPTAADFDRFHQSRIAVLDPVTVDRVFAAGSGPVAAATEITDLDGLSGRAVPIAAGERRVGVLVAVHPVPGDLDEALRIGATAMAIEAVRRDARAAAVAESAGWLVDELRFGSHRPAAELERFASRYGIRLAEPHAAVGLAYDGPDVAVWTTSLSWIESPVRHDGSTAWTLVDGDVGHQVEWLHRRLQPFVHGRVLVASGPVVQGAGETRRSFDLAAGALAVLRHRTERSCVTYEQLGLTGLLLAVDPAQLAAFVDRQLGPLLERPDLLATLDAWFASGGSRAAVAGAVGIHRNSVGYRLERVRALLENDPDDPAVAVDLRAALAARAVLAARERTVLTART